MGTTSSKLRIDIISYLPPELVLEIFSYLTVEEVAECTLVSRRWNEGITNLAPFWAEAASNIAGLSNSAISKSLRTFRSPKKFFVAALKHKNEVSGLNLMPSHIRHPIPEKLLFTHCLDARQQCIVSVQKIAKADSHRYELVVNQLVGIQQVPGGLFSQKIACLPLEKQSFKILWAHLSDKLLYWVNSTGLWSCYDLSSEETIFTWKNSLLTEVKGVVVAKCKHCSMVVLSYWFPSIHNQEHRSVYIVQVVRLGDRTSLPAELIHCKKVQQKHGHSFFAKKESHFWTRKTFLLSSSEEKERGVCCTHTLVLQCDSCTVMQSMHTTCSMTKDLPATIHIHFSTPTCLTCEYPLTTKHCVDRSESLYSELNVSSDGSLLGQVMNNRLCVWSNKPQHSKEKTVELISHPGLTQAYTHTSSSAELVALGHILTVIAYMDSGHLLDYKIQILQTNTGNVLSEFRRIERFFNWSLCCQIDPLHRFYFMQDNEQWLNDVGAQAPPTLLTVHNHHGRVHMEALHLRKTVEQTWRKYWRCAINYGLRE